jgi:hypothetical protein
MRAQPATLTPTLSQGEREVMGRWRWGVSNGEAGLTGSAFRHVDVFGFGFRCSVFAC